MVLGIYVNKWIFMLTVKYENFSHLKNLNKN
jgi:hypothetical protein